MTIMKIISTFFLYAGIMFFTVSLFLIVFFTGGDDIRGYWVLATGWLGFVIFQFAWYANPLNLLAILLVERRPTVAFLLSIAALILATQVFLFNEIPTVSGEEKTYIREFGLGVYLWYLSHGLIVLSIVSRVFLHVIQMRNESTQEV